MTDEHLPALTVRLRKIVYQVHMDQVDADGNIIQEIQTQEPIIAFAKDLPTLAAQVDAVLAQAQTQLDASAKDPAARKPVARRRTRPKR